MTPKLINGFTVYAYSTPPGEDEFARAYMETKREDAEGEPLTFEIFTSRKFPNGIAAMAAARNALAAVTHVDEDGVPDPLPE
jgi:hypothetical protein